MKVQGIEKCSSPIAQQPLALVHLLYFTELIAVEAHTQIIHEIAHNPANNNRSNQLRTPEAMKHKTLSVRRWAPASLVTMNSHITFLSCLRNGRLNERMS